MNEVFKSKWGYHPCSVETYRKIRKLNGLYQKALSSVAAWHRWDRKAPHNRIVKQRIHNEQGYTIARKPALDAQGNVIKIPEPKLCPIFCEKTIKNCFGYRNGKWGEYDFEFIKIIDRGIPEAAKNAKTPQLKEEDVKPLGISVEEIDNLLSKIQ